jgi:hypothetical protein
MRINQGVLGSSNTNVCCLPSIFVLTAPNSSSYGCGGVRQWQLLDNTGDIPSPYPGLLHGVLLTCVAVTGQLQEMEMIRQKVYTLEQAQIKMKQECVTCFLRQVPLHS